LAAAHTTVGDKGTYEVGVYGEVAFGVLSRTHYRNAPAVPVSVGEGLIHKPFRSYGAGLPPLPLYRPQVPDACVDVGVVVECQPIQGNLPLRVYGKDRCGVSIYTEDERPCSNIAQRDEPA